MKKIMTKKSKARKPSENRSTKPSPTTIAIVGLGYVGLPLALQFARNGVCVIGLDIDDAKVESLNRGKSYIKHVPASEIGEHVKSRRFVASSDFSRVAEVEAVIICVPTPLNRYREPDISYILNTGKAIAPYLSRGTLVVLESTTYPGTTEQELKETLEAGSSLVAGRDFYLAFSPEREDPGNKNSRVGEIPKIVGGYTSRCTEKAIALYQRAIKTLVPVSSCRVAEAAKLLENIFRSVNIALVNELKVVYDAMGIDIWEVIAAAKTKPFGFMPFYPGPGLGGHCIPIDPFYLTWKAREFGQHTRFIELAGEINTAMPHYVAAKAIDALNAQGKAVKGARVLIVGLAYKPDVDDARESPSFVLMDLLQGKGAKVAYHDPYVPVIGPTREHSHWAGTRSCRWDRRTISNFDIVVITTAHKCVDHAQLESWARCIVDTRNAIPARSRKVWRA